MDETATMTASTQRRKWFPYRAPSYGVIQHEGLRHGAVAALVGAGLCLLSGCGNGINSVALPATPSVPVSAVSNGPQLGYVWDAVDSSLRPLLGVPGAAQMGQPVTVAGTYVLGAASVRSSFAVLESASGALSVMSVPQGSPMAIAGATLKGATQISFSPSGLNAVVYNAGAGTALLLSGLDGTPQVQPLSAPAGMAALAVSDGGAVAAVYGSGPLTVALLNGSHTVLTSLSGYGGMAFLPGGSDLLLADRATGVVTVVRNTAAAPAAQSFTAATIKSPMAVAGSADGLWAVVANSADTSVVRLDLTGATTPLRIACSCQPTQLNALSGNAVFSLTTPGAATSWVVDASAATPRTVFIPAMVQP